MAHTASEQEMLEEIGQLKIAVGPYPNLTQLLADQPVDEQLTILRVLARAERRSNEIAMHRDRPTRH